MAGLFTRRRQSPKQRPSGKRWIGTKVSNNLSVSIDPNGALTLAGQTATFTLGVAQGTQGALTLAGQTATAAIGVAVGTQGALTLAGQTATTDIGVAIGTQGVITIAGQSVDAVNGNDLTLDIDTAGALTLAGQTATATVGVALGTQGAITVAGQTATLTTGVAVGTAGAVTIAGQTVDAVAATNIDIDIDTAGSLTLTGQSVEISLPSADTGAGRKTRRRRYYVEIDGERFPVESAEEAAALLQQAASLAEKAAETAAQAVVKARLPRVRRLGKVAPVALSARIKTDAPVTPELARAKSAIQAIYDEAAQRAEMQLLLERQAIDEDERDIEDLIAIGAL